MIQNVMADTDADDIRIDLAAWRQQTDVLVAENERLTEALEAMRGRYSAHRATLRRVIINAGGIVVDGVSDAFLTTAADAVAAMATQLVEAQRQPVQVLPVITPELLQEWYDLHTTGEHHEELNTVLARHFRVVPGKPAEPAPPDVLLMHALARVEREVQRNTRRECAAKLRAEAGMPIASALGISCGRLRDLAGELERGK